MKTSFPPPITLPYFMSLVCQWADVVFREESASIYTYSKADILRRFAQLEENQQIKAKLFPKTNIHFIDVDALNLEDAEDWFRALKITKTMPKTVFFILGIDQWLTNGTGGSLSFLQSLQAQYPNISFLLFFSINPTCPIFFRILSKYSIFVENIIIHPIHPIQETRQFITYLSFKWHIRIPKKLSETIVSVCGGNFWLVKEAVRYMQKYPHGSEEELFHHSEMLWRLKEMWDHFLPVEQSVLKKIVMKNTCITDEEAIAVSFLQKSGWVTEKNTLSIPLLTEYIKDQTVNKTTIICDGQQRILVNTVPVHQLFPPQERKLFLYFLEHPKEIVFRDTVSKVIGAENRYSSDWAIDQLVSRLRKTLQKIDIDPSVIKTVRGKGFIFIQR